MELITYYLPVQEDVTIDRAAELVAEFKKTFPYVTVDVLPSWIGQEGYKRFDYDGLQGGVARIASQWAETATPPVTFTTSTN
jgi:hypothetical protein